MFFSTKSEGDAWADRNIKFWLKNGYSRYWIGEVKYNGKIGWTVDFRK